jgi:ABC-type Fe3+/spermidine/putrescine transport system ATPase subunit
MSKLSVRNISHNFGGFSIRNISFEVEDGMYFMMLGNSGAGKSVMLEMIAGLVQPASGSIFLNTEEITHTAIQKRNIGFVFQDQAVFPHLSVRDNIAYPLLAHKTPRIRIKQRTEELSELMSITHLLDRLPAKLSGGELQRVALARALATDPEVLLLDEPLVSLDVQLRDELRALLRRINHAGQTIIHVTHDFEEALYLAHELVFLHQGEIMQRGKPGDVFYHPKTEFVARFAGIRNYFSAEVDTIAQQTSYCIVNKVLRLGVQGILPLTTGHILVRSGDVQIVSPSQPKEPETNYFTAIVSDIYPVRSGHDIIADCGIRLNIHLRHRGAKILLPSIGDEIQLAIAHKDIRFLE